LIDLANRGAATDFGGFLTIRHTRSPELPRNYSRAILPVKSRAKQTATNPIRAILRWTKLPCKQKSLENAAFIHPDGAIESSHIGWMAIEVMYIERGCRSDA